MNAGRDVGHLDRYPSPLGTHSSFPMEVTKLGNLASGPPRVVCRSLRVHACLVCEHAKCNHISVFSPRKEAGEGTRQVQMSLLLQRDQEAGHSRALQLTRPKLMMGVGGREKGRREDRGWQVGRRLQPPHFLCLDRYGSETICWHCFRSP